MGWDSLGGDEHVKREREVNEVEPWEKWNNEEMRTIMSVLSFDPSRIYIYFWLLQSRLSQKKRNRLWEGRLTAKQRFPLWHDRPQLKHLLIRLQISPEKWPIINQCGQNSAQFKAEALMWTINQLIKKLDIKWITGDSTCQLLLWFNS